MQKQVHILLYRPNAQNSRSTLHFKDDDWRMSFIMGNYITLTNVSDSNSIGYYRAG